MENLIDSSFAGQMGNTSSLPNEMVLEAVSNACDFFNLSEIPVVNAAGTCVWSNDNTTLEDDVFGFNREQLQNLGISGEDSLTLIYTHECAHRTLQGAYNDDWEEELACDFFAGVHAGISDMDIDNFEASIGSTHGGESHPAGALRAEFIEFGRQVAIEMKERGIEISYDNCLERCNQHLEEKDGLIEEYRHKLQGGENNFSKEPKGIACSGCSNTCWASCIGTCRRSQH